MNTLKVQKSLTALTRAIIALLMMTGFSLDGCQQGDALFMAATLLWIYLPFIVRTESQVLRRMRGLSARFEANLEANR